MNERIPDIQPETRTLKELSAARLAHGRKDYDRTRRRTLLLEPGGDEWPSALLFDSVLQAIDKVVLLLAITIARQTADVGYLPPQTTLATMANVSSPIRCGARSLSSDAHVGWWRVKNCNAMAVRPNRALTWSVPARYHCVTLFFWIATT
jgi:hypothetical protein